jgi:hypothetical protein
MTGIVALADIVAQQLLVEVTAESPLKRLPANQVLVTSPSSLSPTERANYWQDSAGGLADTKPLSDEAISRESIYADRG